MKVVCLGCGSSSGTPTIGCTCAVCTSSDPRNRRLRSSALVEANDGTTFVIDTGPDFREQMLRCAAQRLDAVLYTHAHADHANGLDDLRAFCFIHRRPVAVFGNRNTLAELEARFRYAFSPPNGHWEKPSLAAHMVGGSFSLGKTRIEPIPVWHGGYMILGWRLGDFAYLTDVSHIPEESLERLQGLQVLFLDCLRERPHPTHLSLSGALHWAMQIKARRTFLIHMTHELEYRALASRLPQGIAPAYDGLEVHIEESH